MDDIELVRSKLDIVELINSYIPLKKAGRNYKTNCPFHSEKTPSFVVSPELQIFRCFGCGESGNVFSFLQKYEGMTFGEALRFLAEKTGVKLQRYRPSKDEQEKDKLLGINHLASEFYHYLLTKHKIGQKALRYLLQRGISKSSVKSWQLGYAPSSWESLQRFLVRKKSYKPFDLEKTGLIIKGRSGWYDRFRGRITFPLHDHRGNVLGFSGRVLEKDKSLPVDRQGAKYINTPETILYHKSNLLYGLNFNRNEIKRANRCVLVEGELDVISSWQAGVKNVVAVKGSALTEGQVNLLKRFCNTIALALDADLAGDQATRRGIKIADKAGLIVTVIDLKKAGSQKDPDDIAQSNPKLWREISKKGQVIYDFYLNSAIRRFGSKSSVAKKKITDELLPIFDLIDNQVVRAHYFKKLSSSIDISEEVLLNQSKKLKQAQTNISAIKKAQTVKNKPKTQVEVLEDYLLSLILQHNNPCSILKDLNKEDLTISKYKRIVEFLKLKCEKAKIKTSLKKLLLNTPEELSPSINQAFLKDLYDLSDDSPKLENEIKKTLISLKQIKIKTKQGLIRQQIQDLEEKKAPQEKLASLQKEFVDLSNQLKSLNS